MQKHDLFEDEILTEQWGRGERAEERQCRNGERWLVQGGVGTTPLPVKEPAFRT